MESNSGVNGTQMSQGSQRTDRRGQRVVQREVVLYHLSEYVYEKVY